MTVSPLANLVLLKISRGRKSFSFTKVAKLPKQAFIFK